MGASPNHSIPTRTQSLARAERKKLCPIAVRWEKKTKTAFRVPLIAKWLIIVVDVHLGLTGCQGVPRGRRQCTCRWCANSWFSVHADWPSLQRADGANATGSITFAAQNSKQIARVRSAEVAEGRANGAPGRRVLSTADP